MDMDKAKLQLDEILKLLDKFEQLNKNDRNDMVAIPRDGYDRLKAENARLREALELILDQYPKDYEIRIIEIAREALKGGE
jgi:hypothetical protein